MTAAKVPGVEARAGKFPGPSLIPELNAIQARLGWLPREELEALSRETRRPLYEIEGLISFYPHFRTDPPPKVAVHACHDLTCWLAGAEDRLAELRARLEGDEDVEFTEVSCLGRCDTAPAVAVNEHPAALADTDALVAAARADELGHAAPTRSGRTEPWPNDPYAPGEERYRVLRSVLTGERTPQEVIAAVTDSGLRGMGGAGFPTGRKWQLVADQPGGLKYAICNADESEPGTFKDRQILADEPHLVLEGLLLGMVCTGAEQGYVFIRHEYGPEERVLREEIEALRAAGLIGVDVLGSGHTLQLDIFTSPGGYILGEESALIEAMEGHRGEPRNKPPFPGVYGLWGRPTLMNSVETFADVPIIVERGAQWWREQGIGDSVGWKFFAVSGHVERPGVYCVPMGTTVRRLLEEAGGVAGGAALQAVQPGGASSNFLGPDQLDVPLDFGTLAEAGSMLGSGALVAIAEGTDLLAAATNVLRFFRNESCGKCVPCRVGSTKAHTLLTDAIATGGLDDAGRERILELETVMRKTSICGLGQVALGPVVSVLGLQRGATTVRQHPKNDDPEVDDKTDRNGSA
ncbi:MAG TPA: NAD(P)H-dependent oxidoreductase subunit E [Pseudonocardia sp.]|mgnify:CR=1 FL=1|jgi:NADH:ubiquinone oxidoreductase subunit F (NADH-binding)/NADH:ubiquinone oxidoreductase subunit E|uniref:NAD(P)H-dependent oxidoreductase subunit E n=1 Tax=Pseudonocardia sp. TaxID=60912 RepID=UPI002B4B38DD|nr:NAD(P)H-dependent oxidoreductase subunit E [Pseudonocardia sp.]HLU60015.1 NAD(P)H-dependent oxidoreductase subunit E [Pseudonocardia sp.]